MASPVSVALMTPAKLSGETCQGVVGCRFVATPNYRSTYSISIGSPLSSLPEHRVRSQAANWMPSWS
jgi:hypothetical protein